MDSDAGRTDGHAIAVRRPYLSPPTPPARARMATERAGPGYGPAAPAHRPDAAGTRHAGPLTARQAPARPALSTQIAHICADDRRRHTYQPAVHSGGYASSHDCRVTCGLRSADRRGRRSRSRGVQRLGRATDRRPLPGRKRAGDYAQFTDLPGLRQRHRRCVRPRIPGFSPGGLGPHLTSSGIPRGLSSGFPFARRVLPPSPAFLWFPVVRRSPVRPLRPLPGSGSPSVSLRVPFP